MSFLFGKKQKQTVTAMAEVMESAAPKINEWLELNIEKVGTDQEPMFQILVHVTPEAGSPFDCQMETSLNAGTLLKPGVHVWVSYDPNQKEKAYLVDDLDDIRTRNPQLKEPTNQAQKTVTLCPDCGKYYEGTPKFCPNCGHPIPS